ncbi:MAG: hypothetical protein Q7T50_05850 [Candidatus Magasanikbacteria bacterium]|nr:hypothetical protein [Candidatus Magasanikbacteria bacterium]
MFDEVTPTLEKTEFSNSSSLGAPEPQIQKIESKEKQKDCTDDPKDFFDRFKDSAEYREILGSRVNETLQRNSQADVKDIEKIALEKDVNVKRAFFNFYRNTLDLTYSAEFYSTDFNMELNEYFRQTRALRQKSNSNRLDSEDIAQLDSDRSQQHDTTATQLVNDGVIPNFRLARVFVHFLAIAEGVDSYDPGRDEYRMKTRGF